MTLLHAVGAPDCTNSVFRPSFHRAQQKDESTMRELRALHAEGHFPPGSMGPKIDAALRFLEGGGERVIIAHLEEAMTALHGETGTHILADDARYL